jgi:hypothetical protein
MDLEGPDKWQKAPETVKEYMIMKAPKMRIQKAELSYGLLI